MDTSNLQISGEHHAISDASTTNKSETSSTSSASLLQAKRSQDCSQFLSESESSGIVDYISKEFNESYATVGERTWNDVSPTSAMTLMNASCNKFLKIVEHQQEQHINVCVAKIVESLHGCSSQLTKCLAVSSFKTFLCITSQQEERRIFAIEFTFTAGICSILLNLMAQFTSNKIAFDSSMFQCILAMVLQIHARRQSINCKGQMAIAKQILVMPETIVLVDFDQEKVIDIKRESNQSLASEQRKDLYELGKLFIALEQLNHNSTIVSDVGVAPFEVVLQSVSRDESLVDLAVQFNCNQHLLKVSKYIDIDHEGVAVLEVQNIVQMMVDKSTDTPSVKIALMCGMQEMLTEMLKSAQYDGIVGEKSGSWFKGIEEERNAEGQIVNLKQHGKSIFEGLIDEIGSEKRKQYSGSCSIAIFGQQYRLRCDFMNGHPVGRIEITHQNGEIVEQGTLNNYTLKHWLRSNGAKVQSARIENLVDIGKVTQTSLKQQSLSSSVIFNGPNHAVSRVNASFKVTEQVLFDRLVDLVKPIQAMNMNNLSEMSIRIDPKVLCMLQSLKMRVDSLDKEEFLVRFLSSADCACLQVLDISNSNSLERNKQYRINSLLDAKRLPALRLVVLNNCTVASQSKEFIHLLVKSSLFQQLTELHLDHSSVDSDVFGKIPEQNSLQVLSINDTQCISDESVIQFADRMFVFKHLRVLSIRGLLKKQFNKSIFSDSNIATMKKLMSSLYLLTLLQSLVLDDCNINDAVLEVLAKVSLPSLSKIYLRNQSKLTYKGFTYLLQSQCLPSLRVLNCNGCTSLVLPKVPFKSATEITLSLLNCKSIIPSSVSDYLRGNPNLRGIRVNAKLLSVDVIHMIASQSNPKLKCIEIYCIDSPDILRFIELLSALDKTTVKTTSNLESIRLCLQMSRSFIDVTSEVVGGGLGQAGEVSMLYQQNSFKITQGSKPEEHPDQLIEIFKSQLASCISKNSVQQSVLDVLCVHRAKYDEFLRSRQITHSGCQFFDSAIAQSNNAAGNKCRQVKLSTEQQQKIIEQAVIRANSQRSDSIRSDADDERIVTDVTADVISSSCQKMQFLDDLRQFTSQCELAGSVVTLDLSKFYVGSDELSIIAFSEHFSQLKALNLQNSFAGSEELIVLSYSNSSMLQSLQVIDLRNTRLPIFPGVLSLLESDALPCLEQIMLSAEKLKTFLANATQKLSRITVRLTNMPKKVGKHNEKSEYKAEDKPIKITVQCSESDRKYMNSLDFHVKKRNILPTVIAQPVAKGKIKVKVNQFMTLVLDQQDLLYKMIEFNGYFLHTSKRDYPHDQAEALLRLMRFQRQKEFLRANASEEASEISSEQQGSETQDSRFIKSVRLTVIGHELSGKKSIVEKFLESNFDTAAAGGGEILGDAEKKTSDVNDNGNYTLRKLEDGLNYGMKVYHSEIYRRTGSEDDKKVKKINLEIRVVHSHQSFHLLRLCALRDSDGIVVVYDTARDDCVHETMSAFNDSLLFASQQPVYVAVNRIHHIKKKKKQQQTQVSIVEAPKSFVECDVHLSNMKSIRDLFEGVSFAVLDLKKQKALVDKKWLSEVSDLIKEYVDVNNGEIIIDFQKVKNEVDLDMMKEFCGNLATAEQLKSGCVVQLLNWGDHEKESENTLNAVVGQQQNTHRLRIRIADTLSLLQQSS